MNGTELQALTDVRDNVAFMLRHARAKNQPEALPLTNALASMNKALELVSRSNGVANNVINPTAPQ